MNFLINRVLKNAERLEARAAKMRAKPKFYAWLLLISWLLAATKFVLDLLPLVIRYRHKVLFKKFYEDIRKDGLKGRMTEEERDIESE